MPSNTVFSLLWNLPSIYLQTEDVTVVLYAPVRYGAGCLISVILGGNSRNFTKILTVWVEEVFKENRQVVY